MAWSAEQVGRRYLGSTALPGLGCFGGAQGEAGSFPETSSDRIDAALPLCGSISTHAHFPLVPTLLSTCPPPKHQTTGVLGLAGAFRRPPRQLEEGPCVPGQLLLVH